VARGVATGVLPAQDRLRAAFEEHASSLLRLCLLLAARREEAEDIVQESFVRIAPRLDRLDQEVVWPYLRRVAINIWKNRIRRAMAEVRAGTREAEGAGYHSDDPGRIDERERVLHSLRGLPPRQRACVVLRYYADLSERETATLLACSVGTVKSQTSKALAKLREVLRDED
jgi:RNA polymerase sigma-70 factor (sigma-E family)